MTDADSWLRTVSRSLTSSRPKTRSSAPATRLIDPQVAVDGADGRSGGGRRERRPAGRGRPAPRSTEHEGQAAEVAADRQLEDGPELGPMHGVQPGAKLTPAGTSGPSPSRWERRGDPPLAHQRADAEQPQGLQGQDDHHHPGEHVHRPLVVQQEGHLQRLEHVEEGDEHRAEAEDEGHTVGEHRHMGCGRRGWHRRGRLAHSSARPASEVRGVGGHQREDAGREEGEQACGEGQAHGRRERGEHVSSLSSRRVGRPRPAAGCIAVRGRGSGRAFDVQVALPPAQRGVGRGDEHEQLRGQRQRPLEQARQRAWAAR